jgi:hypothetical protein
MSKMKFELSKEQEKKFNEWYSALPKIYDGAIGGALSFTFTVTSIGDFVTAKYHNEEINLTEYDLM